MPSPLLPSRARSSVALLGDSVTTFSIGELTTRLGRSWDVHHDSRRGRRVDEMVTASQALLATGLDTVVVNLGTNDFAQGYAVATVQTNFASLVAGWSTVIVVTLSELTPTFGAGASTYSTKAAQWNAWLRTQGWRVVEWASEVYSDPALVYDNIHPTRAGAARLAEIVARALDGHPFSLPAPPAVGTEVGDTIITEASEVLLHG